MRKRINQSEIELEILRNIEANPYLTQRQVAEDLNISLGKTNYIIKALINKGWVKIDNFKKSDNKIKYLYNLTPRGLFQKTRITKEFLQRKAEEYASLKEDIEALKK